MCRVLAASLLLAAVVAATPPPPPAPADNASTTETSKEGRSGPERCLESDSPFWCLAEETSAGISRALEGDRRGKAISTPAETLGMLGELAAATFDLGYPDARGLQEDESRGKKKKRFAYIFMAMATMLAVFLPLKLKAIALMAGTALFVGKLALLIASLVGLKKLVHKNSDETHVHYSGHRSDGDSHYLAYSEHVPGAPFAQGDERY